MKKLFFIAITLLCSCCGHDKTVRDPVKMEDVNRQMIRTNRELVAKEALRIDSWIQRNGHEAEKTGTGLRIIRKETHATEPRPRVGDIVSVEYTLKLLDGTECYSTAGKKPEAFKVGMANVESGLHEGVQLMHQGDKAILVLPPHLAHGLIGDQKKIPPLSSIVYEIQLISIQ